MQWFQTHTQPHTHTQKQWQNQIKLYDFTKQNKNAKKKFVVSCGCVESISKVT